jgi:DNA-binding transcriptional ArsR family regulator/uncharacterized protein YndB with AHSA1/START domain
MGAITADPPGDPGPPAAAPGTDGVFRALADPSRRRLLDALRARNGQSLAELCVGMDMARQSVAKHLAVLATAGLVATRRQGRHTLHHLNPVPINDIADRWINRFDQARLDALADLRRALEEAPVSDATDPTTEYVYVTYIRTTPERLWEALTESAFTRRWFQDTAFDTDWAVGSPMTWHHHGVVIAHPDQVVLAADPPRRLSFTWHTFTPEWARAVGFDEALRAEVAAEPRSRVTFELEPEGELVRLTVTHGGLHPDGRTVGLLSSGWPRVASDLKSFLETGEVVTG